MTDVAGALSAAVNGISALRSIVTDLRKVVGDHQLITDAERVIADIETAVNTIPHEVSAGVTDAEHVAETIWQKLRDGFDSLMGKHTAAVAEAVNQHTEAVTSAINAGLASGTAIATGPQPPTGAVRPVGGASAGAPPLTQPLPARTPAAPAPGADVVAPETVDTGRTITVTDENGEQVTQAVHDTPNGPGEGISITG